MRGAGQGQGQADGREADAAELAGLVARIEELAARAEVDPSSILDAAALSAATAVPPEQVRRLLAGRRVAEWPREWLAAGEDDPQEQAIKLRVMYRLKWLRENRRKDNGDPHGIEEIAAAVGLSRQRISSLFHQVDHTKIQIPNLLHALALEDLFKVGGSGFLTRTPERALIDALEPRVKELESGGADPLAARLQFLGDRPFALRSMAKLSDENLRTALAVLDAFVAQVLKDEEE
ncbi:hypothetical protein [Streptomyces sp. NPDC090022]|uniref:hypothetical protein n=1 Tax=Streptomyces sp. NPDC090022 TaxID=3365920 RepID=UPI0037FA830E